MPSDADASASNTGSGGDEDVIGRIPRHPGDRDQPPRHWGPLFLGSANAMVALKLPFRQAYLFHTFLITRHSPVVLRTMREQYGHSFYPPDPNIGVCTDIIDLASRWATPETIDILAEYVYTGSLLPNSGDPRHGRRSFDVRLAGPPFFETRTWRTLGLAWRMAGEFEMPRLQDLIMHVMLQRIKDARAAGVAPVTPGEFARMFTAVWMEEEGDKDSSELYKLCMDMARDPFLCRSIAEESLEVITQLGSRVPDALDEQQAAGIYPEELRKAIETATYQRQAELSRIGTLIYYHPQEDGVVSEEDAECFRRWLNWPLREDSDLVYFRGDFYGPPDDEE